MTSESEQVSPMSHMDQPVEAHTNNETPSTSVQHISPAYLSIGRIVNVQSRTWAGINKLGGVGRITQVHMQIGTFQNNGQTVKASRVTHVDVKYIVNGGREKVEVEYVEYDKEHDTLEERTPRDHSKSSGRCTACGSFRVDCNFCDWKAEQQQQQEEEAFVQQSVGQHLIVDGGDDLVDSDEEDEMMDEIHERYVDLKRKGRKRKTKVTDGVLRTASSLENNDRENDTLNAVANEMKQRKEKQKKKRLATTSVLANLPETLEGAPVPTASGLYDNNRGNKLGLCGDADNQSKRLVTEDDIVKQNIEIYTNENDVPITHTPSNSHKHSTDKNTTTSIDEEVEKLSTPRPLNEESDEELLTPRPLDEHVSFDGNDEISFHGDPDDDSSIDEVVLNNLAPTPNFLPQNESSNDDYSYSEESDDEYEDFETAEEAPDQTPEEYKELVPFINKLAKDIEDKRIPYTNHKLSILTSILSLRKHDRSDDADVDSLACQSDALHNYIVEKLLREGIDQCNKALVRLTSREKEHNREYYRKNRGLIGQIDVRVWSLNDSISAVDRKVTALRKEIDELASFESDGDFFDKDEYSDINALFSNFPYKVNTRNVSDEQWDPHQHASKKRKQSSQKRQQLSKRRRQQMQDSTRKRSSRGTAESKRSNLNGTKSQNKGETRIDGKSNYDDSMYIDFVGDACETDRQPASRAQLDTCIDQRKIDSLTTANKNKQAIQSARLASSISSTSSRGKHGWTDKNKIPSSRLISRGLNCSTNESSTTASLMNAPRSRISKENQADHTRRMLSEPPLPADLTAEVLFKKLPNITTKIPIENVDCSPPVLINGNIHDICSAVVVNYPSNLKTCGDLLNNLSSLIKKELPQDEVVTIYKCMLAVFQRRCSTFLDLLRSDSKDANFHIKCWTLVFKMTHHKLNRMLRQEDGLLFDIFCKHVPLTSHIMLQVIDSLYSQLLWREWGASPKFHGNTMKYFAQLRDEIASFIPPLKLVIDLVRFKFEPQTWHRSKLMEEKENSKSKLYFVSAVDIDDHVGFLTTGTHKSALEGISRLSQFDKKLPRREIAALWSIIGWFANAPIVTSDSDYKAQNLFTSLIQSNYGIFPHNISSQNHPPSPKYIDVCCQEVKYLATLISSKSIGTSPDLDSLVINIIKTTVELDSKSLHTRSNTSNNISLDAILSKYWCGFVLTPDPKIEGFISSWTPFELSSLLAGDGTTNTLQLSPSTRLLQVCSFMLQVYITIAMPKKAKWNRLYSALDEVISNLQKNALNHKETSVAADEVDAFASAFSSIDEFTREKRVDNPISAYFREVSCYIVISCLIARKHSFSNKIEIGLNKVTRAKLLRLSADDDIFNSITHHLESKEGNAPFSSGNLCSLYTTAKVMSIAVVLHLFADTENPTVILENYDTYLETKEIDYDIGMLKYMVTAIVVPLVGCCDIQETLSKDKTDSTHLCIEKIQSITILLTFIYHRAQHILVAANQNPPQKVRIIVRAIMKLGNAKFSSFVLKSLTRVLRSIIDNLPHRISDLFKSSLKIAFRSCLAAMKNVVALIHSCNKSKSLGELVDYSHDPKGIYLGTYNEFQNFITSYAIPSILRSDSCSHDRVLCRDMSGALMSTFATFCTLNTKKSFLFDLFTANQSYSNIRDKMEDQIYLNKMRACFSSELVRLSKFEYCRQLIHIQIETLLNVMVSSLMDVETLEAFPTCNVKQVIFTGGDDLRKKLDPLVLSSLPYEYPDQEANVIKRKHEDKYLDTVGPNYMLQSLWSYCEQLAAVLCEDRTAGHEEAHTAKQKTNLEEIGQVLRQTCLHLRLNKVLLGIEEISFERECLKRLIFLRRFVIESNRTNRQNTMSIILNSLLENVYRLSEIALYHERQHTGGCVDRDTRLNRGKIMAFQKAYLSFSGSLLTLLLREHPGGSSEQMALIRNIIGRSFTARENIREIIEDVHQKLQCQFHLSKTSNTLAASEKAYLQEMTNDLASTFLSRADDLLINDLYCNSKGLLYSLLAVSSISQDPIANFITIICNQLLLTPKSIMVHTPRSFSDLQTAIDHHIHFTEARKIDSSHDRQNIVAFRESLIANILPDYINAYSNDVQIMSLQLLTKIFKTFSSTDLRLNEKICNSEGNLSSFMALAKVARSIKNRLVTKPEIASNTDDLKACADALLSLPVTTGTEEERTSLQHYATSYTANDDKLKKILTYISVFCKWLDDSSFPENLRLMLDIECELFPHVEKSNKFINPYAK